MRATPPHYRRAGVKILARHRCCCTRNPHIAEAQQISKKEESERHVLQRDLDRRHGTAGTPSKAEPGRCGRLCIDDPDIGWRNPVKHIAHSGGVKRRRRLKRYLKSSFCTASALVGRRNLAAARALCSDTGMEASCGALREKGGCARAVRDLGDEPLAARQRLNMSEAGSQSDS